MATLARIGTRHSDVVKQTAFEVWAYECDRSPRRTAARLRELLDGDTPAPSHQIVSAWSKSQSWDVRADEAIAGVAPNLRGRQLARLIVLGNEALSVFASVMSGEYDNLPAGALQARVNVASRSLELLGLGTAAARGGIPTITVPAAPVDVENLTPVELARVQRERILERRGA